MRKTRAGMPATRAFAQDMNGKAALRGRCRSPALPARSRAFGPAIATVAHCSVTEVQVDLESGHSRLQPVFQPVEHARRRRRWWSSSGSGGRRGAW